MPRLHCPHCQAATDHTIAVGGDTLVAWCKICLESHSLTCVTPAEEATNRDSDEPTPPVAQPQSLGSD